MELRQFLPEVADGVQYLGRGLDLVQKEQCSAGLDRHVRPGREQRTDGPRVVRPEEGGPFGRPFEVDFHQMLEVPAGEFAYQPRFPDLARPAQHQRFAPRIVFPAQQRSHRIAFHDR